MFKIQFFSFVAICLAFVSCDIFAPDPDETDPVVALLGFEDSTVVSGTVTIGCSATDNEAVEKTELYIDHVASGLVDNTSPYTFDWDTFLYPNNTYHTLYVKAWDESGNNSNSDSVIVLIDNSSNFAPSDLSAETFNNAIELNWVDNCAYEEGFHIYRDSGYGYVEIDTVGANITTYTDAGLEYGKDYLYEVSAYVGEEISEHTNSASAVITFFTLEWIKVEAGLFTFGELDAIDSLEYDYEIMQYEVTTSQYVSYLEEALARGELYVSTDSISQNVDGVLYCDLSDPENKISWDGSKFNVATGYERNPIALITWAGANAFSTHYGWRLPTVKEWEKAARGDTGWDYPWGDNPPTCELANYSGCNDGTIAVGLTIGNSPYAVSDMVGNVWEWTVDFYESGSERVAKGGSWNYYTENLQSWYNLPIVPDYTHYLVGFRCVRDI